MQADDQRTGGWPPFGPGWPVVAVHQAASHPVRAVFVCEHASAFLPPDLDGLGLGPEVRGSHFAWDIGALAVARRLSARIGGPLVAGALSRLAYDCNRPLEAPDAIVDTIDGASVPGNAALPAAERIGRFESIHAPFHACVNAVFASVPAVPLITVHSFTRHFRGTERALEIGLLFDADDRMARAARPTIGARFDTRLNMPYGPADGVTHTLKLHGDAQNRPNLMIEVRNDLLSNDRAAQSVADALVPGLNVALDAVMAHA